MTTQLVQRVLDLRAVHEAASRTAEAIDADGSLARGLRMLEKMIEDDATWAAAQQMAEERVAEQRRTQIQPSIVAARRWAIEQVKDPEVRLNALERAGL